MAAAWTRGGACFLAASGLEQAGKRQLDLPRTPKIPLDSLELTHGTRTNLLTGDPICLGWQRAKVEDDHEHAAVKECCCGASSWSFPYRRQVARR